jgi:hypothetical protein
MDHMLKQSQSPAWISQIKKIFFRKLENQYKIGNFILASKRIKKEQT